MAKSTLPYTAKQKSDIQTGWFALLRLVEGSSTQERRLLAVLKDEKKHFGEISAKAHIMVEVMKLCERRAKMEDGVHYRDEVILMHCIGVYVRGKRPGRQEHPQTRAVYKRRLSEMRDACLTWHDAHRTYLEGL